MLFFFLEKKINIRNEIVQLRKGSMMCSFAIVFEKQFNRVQKKKKRKIS